MILGIGTDLTDITRIAAVLDRHGDRFLARCYGAEERTRVEAGAKGDTWLRAAGYARRWAAKEACAKALGLGIRNNIFLKDIIVRNDDAGRPTLHLQGGAKQRLTALTPEGMTADMHITLSDEPPMALAFVILSARTKTA
jgi:holo-[acyl-carrier protein] synthase